MTAMDDEEPEYIRCDIMEVDDVLYHVEGQTVRRLPTTYADLEKEIFGDA